MGRARSWLSREARSKASIALGDRGHELGDSWLLTGKRDTPRATMAYGTGLTELSLEDLKNLLSRLHQGHLTCPIGPRELHAAGLSYLVDRVDHLRGLDERAVRAVLVAVIAERRALSRPSG